jgi:hypothetical protein
MIVGRPVPSALTHGHFCPEDEVRPVSMRRQSVVQLVPLSSRRPTMASVSPVLCQAHVVERSPTPSLLVRGVHHFRLAETRQQGHANHLGAYGRCSTCVRSISTLCALRIPSRIRDERLVADLEAAIRTVFGRKSRTTRKFLGALSTFNFDATPDRASCHCKILITSLISYDRLVAGVFCNHESSRASER